MYRAASVFLLLAACLGATAQGESAAGQLAPSTTLPIEFSGNVSAKTAHNGDLVVARTIQRVRLTSGTVLPSGVRVIGHVIDASGFAYDKILYARQKASTLTLHFDAIEVQGQRIPLNVTVRAIADYFTTLAAYEPKSTDLDSLGTLPSVGGDLLTPSHSEVRNHDDDVVAYNRRNGVYAHLIPNGRCDGNSTEVSMAIFSASACGLYGYANVSATEFGSAAKPSTLTLLSHRTSPEIVKHSTALLEVLPADQVSTGR